MLTTQTQSVLEPELAVLGRGRLQTLGHVVARFCAVRSLDGRDARSGPKPLRNRRKGYLHRRPPLRGSNCRVKTTSAACPRKSYGIMWKARGPVSHSGVFYPPCACQLPASCVLKSLQFQLTRAQLSGRLPAERRECAQRNPLLLLASSESDRYSSF